MTTATTTKQQKKKKRHPMIAFAAGVIAPGLGFVLVARPLAGLLTALVSVAVTIVVPLLVVEGVFGRVETLPSILLAIAALVRFGTAVVSAILALRDPPRTYRPYEHPWWAVGFVLLTFVASSKLRDEIASARIAAFDFVADTSLRPSVAEGTMVVVVKRGFSPTPDGGGLAVNDLVAVRAGSSSFPRDPKLPPEVPTRRGFARIIALPGSVVSVDESGGIKVDGFPVIARPCPATVVTEGHACTEERQATTRGEAVRLTTSTSFSRSFPPTSVGPGQVFVLPDDRGRKLYAPAGVVRIADLEGRVVPATKPRG